MTSQDPGPTVGPLGTHAGVVGGVAAPLVGDVDKLMHTTMAPYGITPVPSAELKPYWDGAKEGKLIIQRCQGCKSYNHPPVFVCNYCGDRDAELKFEQVSGRATLYTHYICYDTSVSGFEEKVPYAVILVELEEQADLLLMSNILNFEYDALGAGLKMGLPLEVVFDKVNDDISIPQFQPRSS
jgi:uncharacterized OB-fold protein